MSKRGPNNIVLYRLLIGLVALSAIALFISEYGSACDLTEYWSNRPQSNDYQLDSARCWIVPPAVYLEDTLAQWLMTILSAVGVLMLWRTLELTRRANEAAVEAATAALQANEIMRSEQRPWVTFAMGRDCSIIDGNDVLSLRWDYKITNRGKGLAQHVYVHSHVDRFGTTDDLQDFFDFIVKDQIAHRQKTGQTLFPDDDRPLKSMHSKMNHKARSRTGGVHLIMCVTYLGPSGSADEIYCEARAFQIFTGERWIGPRIHRLTELSHFRITE